MSELKRAAIDLAEDGFWIFPCRPGTKIPAVEGYRTKKMTVEQVAAWWADHPDHNIGLCPDLNGLVVLDLDLYKPECNWDRGVPATMMVRSASGGEHHYFDDGGKKFPGKFNAYEGVDIKHQGLVVLPPSRFEGGQYAWGNEEPVAALPDWFPTKVRVEVDPMAAQLLLAGRGEGAARLVEVVRSAPNVIDDRETWLAIGHALHFETCGTDYEDDAREVWIDWCLRWEIDGADKQQLRADAVKMWDNALPPEEVLAAGKTPMRGGTILHHLRPSKQDEINDQPRPQSLGGFDLWAPVPPRRWMLGKYAMKGVYTVLSAPGGTGKSSLALTWAMSLALGQGLLKAEPHHAAKVLVWSGEDDLNEMRRRLQAIARHYDITDHMGRLDVETSDMRGLRLVVEDKKEGLIVADEVIDALIADLKATNTEVLIIDPMIALHGANENDNDAMKRVADCLNRIARQADVAIIVVHHVGKGALREGSKGDPADAARGATTIINQARIALALVHMTSSEATHAGLPAESRFSYVKVMDAKANFSARRGAHSDDWFYLKEVRLDNAMTDDRGIMWDEDEVGVPIIWERGDEVQTDLELYSKAILAIRADARNLEGERYDKSHRNSSRWIGRLIADACDLDIGEAGGREDRSPQQQANVVRVLDVIGAMVQHKILLKENVPDEWRKMKPGYVLSDRADAVLERLHIAAMEGEA